MGIAFSSPAASSVAMENGGSRLYPRSLFAKSFRMAIEFVVMVGLSRIFSNIIAASTSCLVPYDGCVRATG